MPLCVSMPPPSVMSVPLAAVVLIQAAMVAPKGYWIRPSGGEKRELSWKAPLMPSKEKACPEIPGA